MSAARLLAILIPLASTPLPAAALSISDLPIRTDLTAEASSTNSRTRVEDFDNVPFVFPGSPSAAEALVDGRIGASGFGSALAESDGNLEVGVRGIFSASTESSAVFKQLVLNDTLNPVSFGFVFSIPAGQAIVAAGIGPAALAPRAGVLVRIEASVADGTVESLFEYGVTVRGSASGADIDELGPIVTRPVTNSGGGVVGVEIDRFDGAVIFPAIPSGKFLDYSYTMEAFGFTGVTEFGYAAALGDPLDSSIGGGGQLVLIAPPGTVTPVPEPASILLSAIGLVALGMMRRCRRISAEHTFSDV